MKNPVERLDAVNKAYVDCVKYKSFTGIIPNTVPNTVDDINLTKSCAAISSCPRAVRVIVKHIREVEL